MPKPRNPSKTPDKPFKPLLAAGIEVQSDVVLTGITKTEGATYQLELPQVTAAPATAVVTRQLILHRALQALAAVAMLVLGIIVKLIASRY